MFLLRLLCRVTCLDIVLRWAPYRLSTSCFFIGVLDFGGPCHSPPHGASSVLAWACVKSSLHITACCLLVFWWAMFERLPFEPATPAGVVTAVVHACQESRLRSAVPLAAALHGKPLGVVATTLAKQLVLCTADGLCMRRPPKALWKVLLVCFMLCSSWIYPEESQWKRTNVHVETLWAACAVCRSLLWLSGCKRRRWAYKAGLLLEDWHIGRHYGGKTDQNIGPRSMSVVLWTAWSHCSLRLSSPNLMFVVCSVLARTLVRFCTVGLLLVLTMSEWLASAVNVVHSTAVSPGGGWSMVLCYFVRIAVTVGGCGTRPCVKLILLSPSSLSVVLTLACAFLPWSSGKFALGATAAKTLPATVAGARTFQSFSFSAWIPHPSCFTGWPTKWFSLLICISCSAACCCCWLAWSPWFVCPLQFTLVGYLVWYQACCCWLATSGKKVVIRLWPRCHRPCHWFCPRWGQKGAGHTACQCRFACQGFATCFWYYLSCCLSAYWPVVKQSVRFAVSICSMPWNDHERAWALSRVRFVISAPSQV